jgi:hypothetical protein
MAFFDDLKSFANFVPYNIFLHVFKGTYVTLSGKRRLLGSKLENELLVYGLISAQHYL